MKSLINKAKSFLKSEDGPTATEYAVMLALIIAVCITAVQLIGEKVESMFNTMQAALPGGAPGP
ncbi:MAG: Flp family type IVb pilin [Planctomycetota bacterium]|jgi:pilus assembly protein Flp/PilA